jgi:A/G-specific adenine glycosylase
VHIDINGKTTEQFRSVEFNAKLKSWYLGHHRPLPWRATTDPYKIWLSEIILQQTRVAQGTPYYNRFIENYPTVFDLAAAEERDVLRLWQGLGYYSRARNMHYTARYIVNELGGKFPETASGLARLKGLGAYTSAAIASFAFNEVVPAIDGNVYRVLARLFGIFTDIMSHEAKKEFTTVATQLISQDDPATFNQAMIELGAIQCVPVSPNCTACPFNDICYANEFNMQQALPVKLKKVTVRNRYLNYLILEQDGKLALRERRGKDIWTGLYDFYLVESADKNLTVDELLDAEIPHQWALQGNLREIGVPYTHLLTHQRLNVRFWWITLSKDAAAKLPSDFAFYDKEQVEVLPKPILMDQVLREEKFL